MSVKRKGARIFGSLPHPGPGHPAVSKLCTVSQRSPVFGHVFTVYLDSRSLISRPPTGTGTGTGTAAPAQLSSNHVKQ